MIATSGSDLWQLGAGWETFVLRGAFVFLFVLLLMRFGGKRQIGQMTPFDLVLLLLLSNAVQNAMNGGDNSITAGVILAVTLAASDAGLGFITRRSRRVERLVEGEPELLVHNGRVHEAALARSGVTREDLLAAMRAQDCASFEQVHAAILDVNGHISVLTRKGRA